MGIEEMMPPKPNKNTIQIDIRSGEFFYFSGAEIKRSIDARIQNVLRPAYERSMGHITRLIGDPGAESTSALIVSLMGCADDWGAATSEIHRNAEIAVEHGEEIQDLARMASAFSDDAQYVVGVTQLKRYGLGS